MKRAAHVASSADHFKHIVIVHRRVHRQRDLALVEKVLARQVAAPPAEHTVAIDALMHNVRRYAARLERADKVFAAFDKYVEEPMGAFAVGFFFQQSKPGDSVQALAIGARDLPMPVQVGPHIGEIASPTAAATSFM